MARETRPPEQLSKEGEHLFKTLNEGPDIACVLVGAAALEQAVMSLLQKFLIEGNTSDGLFKNGSSLGDFFSCSRMAYCLGLITTDSFNNLKAIAEIRNLFAHSHLNIDFADDGIMKKCDSLVFPRPWSTWEGLAINSRSRFQFATVSLWSRLLLDALAMERRKKPDNPTAVASNVPTPVK